MRSGQSLGLTMHETYLATTGTAQHRHLSGAQYSEHCPSFSKASARLRVMDQDSCAHQGPAVVWMCARRAFNILHSWYMRTPSTHNFQTTKMARWTLIESKLATFLRQCTKDLRYIVRRMSVCRRRRPRRRACFIMADNRRQWNAEAVSARIKDLEWFDQSNNATRRSASNARHANREPNLPTRRAAFSRCNAASRSSRADACAQIARARESSALVRCSSSRRAERRRICPSRMTSLMLSLRRSEAADTSSRK